jgi:hypothetical protein
MLIVQGATATLHPLIQLVGIGEDGPFIAPKPMNRKPILRMPALDSPAGAPEMPGDGFPAIQPLLRR